MGEACRTHGPTRNAHIILVGKPEENRSPGKLMNKWEDNIRMELKETGCEGMDYIHLALVNTVVDLRIPYEPVNFLTS
jgi:hypothetical protein